MLAGPQGLSVRDIIHQAAVLQVAAREVTPAWVASLRHVLCRDANVLHAGDSRYTHRAFRGTTHALCAWLSQSPAFHKKCLPLTSDSLGAMMEMQ